MRSKRILILGGTGLARAAANALHERGADITTSLAGVTSQPNLPRGRIRTGGFGGAQGLAQHIGEERYDFVIDATHAFAAKISKNVAQACAQTNTRLLRIEHKPWVRRDVRDLWVPAVNLDAALAGLPCETRAGVTIGRKEIGKVFGKSNVSGFARMIEPPDEPIPQQWTLILARPPFTLEAETRLFTAHDIQYLICKNSGGPRTAGLDAAANLGIGILMIARPQKPKADSCNSVDELLGSPVLND